MSDKNLKLLLCTNGASPSLPAIEYGTWLAGLLQMPVVLLGIVEPHVRREVVEQSVASALQDLAARGVTAEARIETGPGEEVLAAQTAASDYFTVLGPFGRPAWQRMVHGRSIRRIVEKVQTPIFYVRKAWLKMERILVCTGGLDLSESMVHVCFFLALRSNAEITLLHIVEPITLQYPVSAKVDKHWEEIYDTDTPQGRHLRKALEEAQGAKIELRYKVRHGNIVHEIVDEARAGGYDLLGMGSPYSAHSLRHLYMPNVTAEVAETLVCPILTVRQGHELISNWEL